jgi:hypothetical protein
VHHVSHPELWRLPLSSQRFALVHCCQQAKSQKELLASSQQTADNWLIAVAHLDSIERFLLWQTDP